MPFERAANDRRAFCRPVRPQRFDGADRQAEVRGSPFQGGYTATFYQALAAHAAEPILAGIAARIRSDEINHYKHFYGYFRMYDADQPPGRLRVLGALKRRILEVRNDDVECALWHAYATNLGPAADKAEFRALRQRITRRVRRHYPVTMAAKMLLKPLSLPAPLAHLIQGPMARLAGWLIC